VSVFEPGTDAEAVTGPGAVDGFAVRRLLEVADRFGLRLVSGREGLDRRIRDTEVQKPGLVLAGVQAASVGAVQVIGMAENSFLAVRSADEQRRILLDYLQSDVPCVVVTRGVVPSAVIEAVAAEASVPLFRTPRLTGDFMRAMHAFLTGELTARADLHGVLVQVHDIGVLITGDSGVGKSESALELMLRGHRLVADDRVRVTRRGQGLRAAGAPPLGHYVEVRGLGVLHAGDLFGQAAVLEEAPINLVVELVPWDTGGFDRTGLEERCCTILGLDVPHVRLPVRPGRNIAMIIEVAVRNQILKNRGVHSARRFAAELEARLAGGSESSD
jgi:HPr kinase/phosphorylase